MRRGPEKIILGALLAACLLCRPARSQCVMSAPGGWTESAAISVKVEIEKIRIPEVAGDHLRLSMDLGFTPSRDAKVLGLSFEDLRLNDIPVFIGPVSASLTLERGRYSKLPRPLEMDIYYRDLDSMRPLILMLTEGRVRLEGTAIIRLDLPWAARMVLRLSEPHVRVNVQQAFPAEFPAGESLRDGAVSMVESAGRMLGKLRPALDYGLAMVSASYEKLSKAYVPRLLLVQSRFALRGRRDETVLFECIGMGLRISPDEFVVTKNLLKPWDFDLKIARAVQKGSYRVDARSVDLWVWPANAALTPGSIRQGKPALPLQLSRGEIRIARVPPDEYEKILVANEKVTPARTRLQRREGPANLALLRLARAGDLPATVALEPAPVPTDPAVREMTAFRFVAGGRGDFAYALPVAVSVVKEGTGIRLVTPLDSSMFGTPLISDQGIVGILQTERSGRAIEEVFQVLKPGRAK